MNTYHLSKRWDWSSMSATGTDNHVSSHAGLGRICAVSIVRRLKPTVNQVPSLRDFDFDMDRMRNMSINKL